MLTITMFETNQSNLCESLELVQSLRDNAYKVEISRESYTGSELAEILRAVADKVLEVHYNNVTSTNEALDRRNNEIIELYNKIRELEVEIDTKSTVDNVNKQFGGNK